MIEIVNLINFIAKKMINLFRFLFVLALPLISAWRSKSKDTEKKKPGAVVTLVSGSNSVGYVSGAMALGQSIKDIGSKLDLIVLVTNEVPNEGRKEMAKLWKVVEVETVRCNHKHNLDAKLYDLNGEKYKQGIARW